MQLHPGTAPPYQSVRDLGRSRGFIGPAGGLYLLAQSEGPNLTDEDVHRAFLKHTPEALEAKFRDLYKQLHGEPLVDAES